jgi:hypothetical protein
MFLQSMNTDIIFSRNVTWWGYKIIGYLFWREK